MRTQHTLYTFDQYPLAVTRFLPEVAPSGQVLLIGSATAVPQTYYEAFCKWLAAQGHAVYTFDYRGIGRSKPVTLRGFEATMTDWGAQDLDAMISYVRREHPDASLTFVGHSVGGQLPALTPESRHFERVLLIASQIGYRRNWPIPHRWGFDVVLNLIMPLSSRLYGYFPGSKLGIFHDLPKEVALEWARWCRTKGYLFALIPRTYLDHIEASVLSLGFTDDIFAPEKATKDLISHYKNCHIEYRSIRPADAGVKKIGHFGFFRKRFADSLWPIAGAWLRQPIVRSTSQPSAL